MRAVRTALSVAMVVVGAYIFAQMLHYPIKEAFTGIILGLALIALGLLRLRALYARGGRT